MDKLSLEVEFPIDTARLQKEAKEARAQIEGVGETAEVVQARVEKEISEVVVKTNQKFKEREGLLERLKRRMAELKEEADKSTSVFAIEKANADMELFEQEINRLSKVGRQGFDDMGKAIPDFAIPTGKMERLTYAANLYKKAAKEATNPDLIAKYNGKLQQTQLELARMQNVGKTGFDELGNKILSLEKDTSTFVGTLSAGVERLRRLAYIIPGLGITGLLAMAIGPLKKLVIESGLFEKKLTEAQKQAKLLSDALGGSEYKKAVTTISELRINLDLAKKGMYDKKEVVDAYNESIGAVSGQVTNLNEVEQGLIDNAEDYVKMMLYKAGATLALEEAAKKAVEVQRNALKDAEDFANGLDKVVGSIAASGGGSQFGTSTFDHKLYEKSLKEDGEKRKVKRDVQLKKEQADEERVAKELTDKAAEYANRMGGLLGLDRNKEAKVNDKANSKAEKEMERSISAAQTMQQKIYDFKAEYTRKALTKDKEELQSVHDKFIKITEEAERFNKNPKNKVKVSFEELAEVRDQAIADLVYKQDTEKLKISLSEQKKLYQDYEEYKISLGKEKADEKYQGLIDIEKSHLENLRAELEKIPVDGASGSQSARKEELEKQIREEESLLLKKFNDLLKANQSYQDKVKIAIEQFEADKAKLIADGKLDEAQVLEKSHPDNLLALDENHVKQLDAYRKLFEGIESLSNAQAKKVIDNAKEMLANTDMPEALYLKILSMIKESEKALSERIYERVGEIGKAFDEMAAGIGDMNEGLRNSLGILGDMLHAASTVGKSIGGIKTGIADYGANKEAAGGGVLGTIAGVAGIAGPIGAAVGAVANLAKGVFGIFKGAKESRIQAEKELAAFDAQKLNAEFEINATYRDRLRMQVDGNKESLSGLKESHALLKSQRKEVEKDEKKLLKALQGEQFVAGKKTEKSGGFLGFGKKTKVVDVMGSLAGKSYEDIEKLFASNQLTDRAKELFLQLEKLKKEGVDVDKMIADNTAAIWEKATGTTSSALTDSIITGFANGYRTAADFANDFGDLMSGAARSFFKDFVENQEVEAFYKKFAEMAEDGMLTDAQREELKLEYEAMIRRINQKREDLEGIAGGDFLKDPASKDKGIGGIQRELTTEKTASEFTGLTRANYELNKRQFGMTEKMLEIEKNHMDGTFAMLRHTALIEEHTGNTVKELRLVVEELKVINKNTDPASFASKRAYTG